MKTRFWVEQATGRLRRTASPLNFSPASCRRKRAGSPFHPLFKQALKPGSRARWQAALSWGRRAVALGPGSLELARIHERALATLEVSNSKNGPIKRAEIFSAKAITPIVETHHAARQNKIDRHRLNDTLGRRTLEPAATNRQLQCGILRRKSVEAALKKSDAHYGKLLKDSWQLQERHTISHQLHQDEIAETVLSIHVRLLNLKTAARGNTTNLTKEIASTQRMVEESVQSINRFARELDLHQPA